MNAIRYAWLRWQEIRRGPRHPRRRPVNVTFVIDTPVDQQALIRALRRELNRQAVIGSGTRA